MSRIATLSLFRFERMIDRLWAVAQMGAARIPLARQPGLTFYKLVGSGTGEGFTPIPNTAVWGILAAWQDEAAAREGIRAGPAFCRFKDRAMEDWTVFLDPLSARGAWSGRTPFEDRGREVPAAAPLAVLTRATIRPRIATRFWGRTPDISRAIGADPNVLFKIGVGEVPWLHQVTFSIWPDGETMTAFARTGPHADAIRAVRREGWFKEELYARFAVLGDAGRWGGASPLRPQERTAA